MDIVVADDLLSILLLYSIPNTYENFRCAIESRDQLFTPDALKIKLLKEANSCSNSNAVNDHQEAQRMEDSNKHKRYDKNRNSSNKNGFIKANKVKHIECFYCHKRGHKVSQYLKKKNNDHKAQLPQVPEISKTEECLRASNIQDEDNQGNSIITDVSLNINMKLPMERCIDSGAKSHMCCDINCFESIEPIKNQKVKLASDKLAEIKDTKSEYIGMVYENINTLMDWHYRYGHLNEYDLWRSINKNMVNGLPNVRLSKNGNCVQDKFVVKRGQGRPNIIRTGNASISGQDS